MRITAMQLNLKFATLCRPTRRTIQACIQGEMSTGLALQVVQPLLVPVFAVIISHLLTYEIHIKSSSLSLKSIKYSASGFPLLDLDPRRGAKFIFSLGA